MEILWYIVASIGAGIGTGLAGLSAATVMVPILIVLCPSFARPLREKAEPIMPPPSRWHPIFLALR